ncbi:MAG: hypothetical protein JSS81_12010 [Acidobacteria bacterium]|nr:hypothetical protein [Acidobacteriota bacterium]
MLLAIVIFGASAAFSQSTNQNFPTPVTTSEIAGTIRARDLGDARLTTYFYAFNGNQGDVFINVVTKNLDGDIDIFTADGLKPLTKITVYSDNPDSETGRVIYLRQPEKLILRVEGKTPTDEPATFRIKFAGSFAPLTGIAATAETKEPEVKKKEEGDVRVNSVGTIIEVKPKPTPVPKPTPAKKEEKTASTEKTEPKSTETAKKEEPKVTETTEKNEVETAENVPPKKEKPRKEETAAEKEKPKKTPSEKPVKPKPSKETARRETPSKTETPPKTAEKKEKKTSAPEPVEPALLENIRLIVVLKDGTKIEKPMSEILKVGVDKGILTIIAKDGEIARYSILDVAKMTIE